MKKSPRKRVLRGDTGAGRLSAGLLGAEGRLRGGVFGRAGQNPRLYARYGHSRIFSSVFSSTSCDGSVWSTRSFSSTRRAGVAPAAVRSSK